MTDSKQMLMVGLGAAGVAAALCYLMSDSGSSDKKDRRAASAGSSKAKPDEVSKETVRQILDEIVESQEFMKNYMKDLTKELRAKDLSFEATYDKVSTVKPKDPMETHRLSMAEFDNLLEKYHTDPQVRDGIAKIMGAPNEGAMNSAKVKGMSVKKIVEVHQFMLTELEKFVGTFQSKKGSREFDMKIVTIVAQAIVGAKMESKYEISSDDIEGAVLLNHMALEKDKDFAQVQIKIQQAMGQMVPPM